MEYKIIYYKTRMTVEDNVKTLLEKYPKTRGNDKILLWYYWYLIDKATTGKEDLFVIDFIEKCTTPESITRARREIQSSNPHLQPEDHIQQARSHLEQQYKQKGREYTSKKEFSDFVAKTFEGM